MERPGGKKRVLLVDDDPEIAKIYSQVLEFEGYEVDLARDGVDALQRIHDTGPDLVVLDIFMPTLDGWEVLKCLKHAPGSPPVVVISAVADAKAALAEGADASFTKPFPLAEFRKTCASLLRASGSDVGPLTPLAAKST